MHIFLCIFHLLVSLNVALEIAATLLRLFFSSSKNHQYFVLKLYVSRHKFLQSPLRRSNIYDMRFLFRILARRRGVSTERLYMHSKLLSESLSSVLALAREKLFSFSSLSSRRTRPKSEHVACEKNRRSRETRRSLVV